MTVTNVTAWTTTGAIYSAFPAEQSGTLFTTGQNISPLPALNSPIRQNFASLLTWGAASNGIPIVSFSLTRHLFHRDAELVGIARPKAGQLYPRT